MENNPYAPPASSVADPSKVTRSQQNDEYEFRDPRGIGAIVSAWLLIGILMDLANIASSFMQLNLLSHAPYGRAQAIANDERERLVGYGHVLVYLTTVVFFSRWIYRAHRNLPALGAENLRFRPGWALGSFFVPIANLWLPFQAMRDLVKASRSPRQWELEDTPFLIIVWWTLWIIVNLLGNGSMRAQFHAHTVPDIFNLTVVQIAFSVLSIPLALIARYIVQRVSGDQSDNYGR
jgi:hypothetical protein